MIDSYFCCKIHATSLNTHIPTLMMMSGYYILIEMLLIWSDFWMHWCFYDASKKGSNSMSFIAQAIYRVCEEKETESFFVPLQYLSWCYRMKKYQFVYTICVSVYQSVEVAFVLLLLLLFFYSLTVILGIATNSFNLVSNIFGSHAQTHQANTKKLKDI